MKLKATPKKKYFQSLLINLLNKESTNEANLFKFLVTGSCANYLHRPFLTDCAISSEQA